MNKAILIGRFTSDPEMKFTPSGKPVCKFTIAVNGNRKDSEGNRSVEFIDIVVWNKLAESVVGYMSKGRLVAVEGRLTTRSYIDKEGIRRRIWEVIANSVSFLDSKRDTTINEEEEL